MPDWNKEIKLSGAFGRGKKKPEEAPAAMLDASEVPAAAGPAAMSDASEVPAAAGPAAPKQSLLKKEISLSLRRKDKTPKASKAPKPSRAARHKARAAAKAEKPARLSRSERRVAKQEAREAKKAEKAAGRNAPKEPRRARRQAPPAPAVPLMRAFNLLPRDDPREARGRRPNTAQLILAVLALVAFAGLGAYFLMLNASVSDKRAEADSLRAAAAAQSNPAVPEPSLEDETNVGLQEEQQARTAALSGALGRRVAWDRLLREFSLVVPDDVSLTKMTAAGGGAGAAVDPAAAPGSPQPESTFTIEGYTTSQEAVARLLGRLSVLPELSVVDLESSTATQLGSTKVFQFVIRTVVKPVSGATL